MYCAHEADRMLVNTNSAAQIAAAPEHTKTAEKKEVKVPFAHLLSEAVTKPGILSSCYSKFYNYSLGNQMWLWAQLLGRDAELAPVATFKRWLEVGRVVKKGEKSLAIVRPFTVKGRENAEGKQEGGFTGFTIKNCLFTVNQTEQLEGSEPYQQEAKSPLWDVSTALATLGISEVPFASLNGNSQGYATGKSIAINPVAVFPHKTRFHEIAHVVLGHTKDERMDDGEVLTRDVKEVEAESVAYILCSLLGLPGLEESRGYIQNWLSNASLQDKTAQRIFSVANKVLLAGNQKELNHE